MEGRQFNKTILNKKQLKIKKNNIILNLQVGFLSNKIPNCQTAKKKINYSRKNL